MTEIVQFDTKMYLAAVWILAKREILAFWRNKSRIISSFAQSLIFLVIFSAGFSSLPITIQGVSIDSRAFTASGICALTILFSGIFGGMGLMRDKMFGFMKELIVTPVTRTTLMFGRTLGIAIQCLIQTLIILILSIIFGFFGYNLDLVWRVFLVIPVAIIASLGVVGLGLTISTRMSDFQSFGLIQTFLVMPMFWLSGALFAYNSVPQFMQIAMLCNPYTYSVDLFRAAILGVSFFPVWLDLIAVMIFGIVLILIGAKSFNKMEV